MVNNIVTKLNTIYPNLKFTSSNSYYWSPETKEIFYKKGLYDDIHQWSVLHEAGHALLNHTNYNLDFQLLAIEIEAWEKAKEIANNIGLSISNDHIQDCLDTYRDWLHRRSICPKCSNKSFQQRNRNYYRCFNCHTRWRVSSSRFCRTYRMADKTILSNQLLI